MKTETIIFRLERVDSHLVAAASAKKQLTKSEFIRKAIQTEVDRTLNEENKTRKAS